MPPNSVAEYGEWNHEQDEISFKTLAPLAAVTPRSSDDIAERRAGL
jgi:hypothetical protein